MYSEIIIALIGVFSSVVSGWCAYLQGAKKANAEADGAQAQAHRTSYESLALAMDTLQKDFSRQITSLRDENERLRKRIAELEAIIKQSK